MPHQYVKGVNQKGSISEEVFINNIKLKHMKTKSLFVAVLSLVLGTSLSAQITVNQDGGVRFGTAPEPLTGVGSPAWTLTSKGFEVNLGVVKFHTPGGAINFTGNSRRSSAIGINPGGSVVPVPAYSTSITGDNLALGAASDRLYMIYADYMYLTNQAQIGSDRRMKSDIQRIENAREIVMQLDPVSYDLLPWDGFVGDSSLLKDKAGYIAQDVLEVLPGAVGYQAEIDRYSLDYNYFIPYLTRTIQEQEVQLQEQAETIAEQEARLTELELLVDQLLENGSAKAPSSKGKTGSENDGAGEAELYQNNPNPFSESTILRYVLPNEIKSAEMVLHSTSGQMQHSYELPLQSGLGQLVIEAGSLSPGMYTYSLLVNGQLVSTKRMVVTE